MADPFSGNIGGQSGTAWLSDISSGLGIAQNLQQGGLKADVQAATSAAKLGSNLGAFGGSTGTVGSLAADVTNLGNIISGIQQGGVAGYGGAAVNAAALASRTGALGSLSGTVGAVAGPLAGAISLYDFVQGWQSGATGADALRGAQTGATIGSVVPGVGTLIGAGIGAAVGAISSAFGGGRADPETMGLNNYVPQYTKNPAIAAQLNPAQNYQLLAGVFDAKDNSPGHSTALEQHYGRMGEGAFMNDVFTQVNNAIQSGRISPSATPAQIYSQVVNPYLTSRGMGIQTNGSQNFTTSSGTNFGGAMQAAVQNLIGQWQSGALSGKSQIGISGQTDPNMPAFAGAAIQAQPAAQTSAQTVQTQLASIVSGFPFAGRTARM